MMSRSLIHKILENCCGIKGKEHALHQLQDDNSISTSSQHPVLDYISITAKRFIPYLTYPLLRYNYYIERLTSCEGIFLFRERTLKKCQGGFGIDY